MAFRELPWNCEGVPKALKVTVRVKALGASKPQFTITSAMHESVRPGHCTAWWGCCTFELRHGHKIFRIAVGFDEAMAVWLTGCVGFLMKVPQEF